MTSSFLPENYSCPRTMKILLNLAIQTLDKVCLNLNISLSRRGRGGGVRGEQVVGLS